MPLCCEGPVSRLLVREKHNLKPPGRLEPAFNSNRFSLLVVCRSSPNETSSFMYDEGDSLAASRPHSRKLHKISALKQEAEACLAGAKAADWTCCVASIRVPPLVHASTLRSSVPIQDARRGCSLELLVFLGVKKVMLSRLV